MYCTAPVALRRHVLYTTNHMQKPSVIRRFFSALTGRRTATVLLAFVIFASGVVVGQGNIGLHAGTYTSETGLPKTLGFNQVNEVYQALRNNYDGKLTEQQVLDGIKHGIAQSTGDPYTVFFTANEAQAFNSELQGTITGIGAQLGLNEDGNVVIVAPLAGSPAEAAGLRAKDIIVSVDGKSTSGMSVNEAVQKIRGKKGTTVELSVVRGGTQALTFTVKRDVIQIPTAVSKILSGNIGYLQVNQFSDDTDRLVTQAVDTFKAKGVKGVILDLRDNPGGEVSTAVQLSSLWLQPGDLIVQQRRGDTVIDNKYANSTNSLHGMKTVVLINGGSASASEITTLALKDHKAAYVIGEQSYGKGVVQQLIPFSDGSSLKVTISKWYSPNGTNVNHKGITPDKTVTPTEADYKNNNDVQLQAAEAWFKSN